MFYKHTYTQGKIMRRVNIYLSDKQDDNLDYLSEITDKSRSDLVREAIDQYTEKYKSDINNFLAGVIDVTKENHFMREFETNPVSFIEDNMKINTADRGIVPFKLYDVQKKLVNTLHNYNEVIINKSRQAGISRVAMGYLIHYIIFNENKNIFLGTPKNSQAVDLLDKLVEMLDSLPSHIRPVIKDKTKTSFVCNGNRIIAKACHFEYTNSARFDFIYLDEFSWVKRDIADEFMTAIYPTLVSGNSYKLIIASTPKDCNHFYKLWTDAISNHNNLKPVKIHYKLIPGRDEEWAKKEIQRIGVERFAQEYECKFLKEDAIAI